MPNYRKITAIMTCSNFDPELSIVLLDYDDPISTRKVIKDPIGITELIIAHAEEIDDPSEFDPCDYIYDFKWVYCGYDWGTRCRAWDKAITEEEFNNPPDKWKNARVESQIGIIYGDGTHERI